MAVVESLQTTPSRVASLRAVAARRAARAFVSPSAAITETDEATLIQQARDGSRDAFGVLYERHRATIARCRS